MKINNNLPSLNFQSNLQKSDKVKSSSESKTNKELDVAEANGVKADISSTEMDLQSIKTKSKQKISNEVDSQKTKELGEGNIKNKDMAQEIMKLTKEQIIKQPGNAILAQANQNPQNVLNLLE